MRTIFAGMSFPLEVHFVHMSEDGSLAVVGVLFPYVQRTVVCARVVWSF